MNPLIKIRWDVENKSLFSCSIVVRNLIWNQNLSTDINMILIAFMKNKKTDQVGISEYPH